MMTIFIQWYFWFTSHTLFSDSRTQTGHLISSCKALMRKKSIEGFVVLFVHSNVTIIHDKIWKTARSKKLLPRRKKKSLDSLLYDSNNANDKSNSPRFTIERTHLHNPWLLLVYFAICQCSFTQFTNVCIVGNKTYRYLSLIFLNI